MALTYTPADGAIPALPWNITYLVGLQHILLDTFELIERLVTTRCDHPNPNRPFHSTWRYTPSGLLLRTPI